MTDNVDTRNHGMTRTTLAIIFMVTMIVTGCNHNQEGLEPETGFDRTIILDTKPSKTLSPCPKTPNCVSSLEKGDEHYIEPIHFSGAAVAAQANLLAIIESLKRARVVEVEVGYIHAEFTSAILRFVDDVEFYFDERQKVIQVRSASRVGYSDLGVNRRRVDTIRKLMNERKK
jgi:uncharacterized protein (DUF1499 family)